MEIWQGWLGVSVAWVILSVLLLLTITNSKIHLLIRIPIVAFTLWFAVALYYAGDGFRGKPIIGYPPYGSIIARVEIVEDNPTGEPGGIYLIVFHPHESIIGVRKNPLDPRFAFSYFKEGEPVYYKIPYTRERHNEILDKLFEAHNVGGRVVVGGGSGEGGRDAKTPGFVILNPQELLKKQGSEE